MLRGARGLKSGSVPCRQTVRLSQRHRTSPYHRRRYACLIDPKAARQTTRASAANLWRQSHIGEFEMEVRTGGALNRFPNCLRHLCHNRTANGGQTSIRRCRAASIGDEPAVTDKGGDILSHPGHYARS